MPGPEFAPPSDGSSADTDHTAETGTMEENLVWVKTGYDIHPVRIEKGIDNDIDVEVKLGLKEGDEVIIAMSMDKVAKTTSSEKSASSPFMPKPPSRRNSSKTK